MLRNKRAFLPLLLAPGITAMITFGVTAWLPATFIRQWGWTPGEIGPAYGVIILTFGIGGMLLSGFLADYLTARGKQVGSIVISLVATGVLVITGLVLAFAPTPTVALVAVAATTFFLGMPVALAPPILQAVTPNQLRGQVTSIYLLLINLIGLGLGPFLVAFSRTSSSMTKSSWACRWAWCPHWPRCCPCCAWPAPSVPTAAWSLPRRAGHERAGITLLALPAAAAGHPLRPAALAGRRGRLAPHAGP